MSIEQEEKIDRKHASLQVAINNWFEKTFPNANRALDGKIPFVGVVMPSGSRMTVDTISLHMASAALEVLKLALDNAGIEAN